VPSAGGARRLARAIVLGDARSGVHFARGACREARAVLAGDDDGVRRDAFEFLGIEVTAARDAVDVLRLVLMITGGERFALALGESLLSLSHAGRRAFHA